MLAKGVPVNRNFLNTPENYLPMYERLPWKNLGLESVRMSPLEIAGHETFTLMEN